MMGGGASWKLQKAAQKTLLSCSGKQRTNLNSKRSSLSRGEISSPLPSRGESIACSSFTSIHDYNARLRELGRRCKVYAARKLFDNMPERDKVSYASMVCMYLKHGEFHKAEKLFFEIPVGMRSVVVNSAMVHGYAKAGRIDRAKEVFDEMPERNAFTFTSLISGYFTLGKVDDALELFSGMPEREKNVITWTNVIAGLGQNGLVDEARGVFDRMPVKDVVSWTAMIKAYVDSGEVDEAFGLFQVMPQRNVYSWNTMMFGFLDENKVNEAVKLFASMPWRNVVSWMTMIKGLARNGMIELSRKYFDQMPNKDILAWNAMIKAYADEGCMVEAGELFKLMPDRDIATWNAMIDGYAKDQLEDEAFGHFNLMLRSGMRPDEAGLSSLLTSCSGNFGVLQAHGLVVRLGFERQTILITALINMYYRSGDVNSARIAFDNLEARDVVTWTAIISAYSNHGFGMEVLEAFAQMIRSGSNPDEVTFTGVLSACSHAGLFKKVQMIFGSIRAFGVEPTPEHYSCLVDTLGRAGLVNEAMKVVVEMPPDKCNGVVLTTLLGACRLHGDGGLAKQIGDELIKLEPASSGGYSLLANVYAASGKWDKLLKIRQKMGNRKVKKVPGFSHIQVNGKTRVFVADDKSHPEMKEIYMLLQEKLLPQMQDTDHN